MEFEFDQVIDRKGSWSNKWDDVVRLFGSADVLPMWVADMDFSAPPSVQSALAKRLAHGVYGYVSPPASYVDALLGWLARRHHFFPDREWVTYSPGVVPSLGLLVQALTEPGDAVIIQPPVYSPFAELVKNHDRRLVINPLRFTQGRYEMDLQDLEMKLLQEKAKVLILCSPHNPVGRVWTKSELTALGELCQRYGVFVLADEIHSDLILPGHVHTPYAALGDAFAAHSATCLAPSKTFNLAGLQTAFTLIADPLARERYNHELQRSGFYAPNAFGATAAEAAYTSGDEWLDALLIYLQANVRLIDDTLLNHLPGITWSQPEGTYLAWLDCRAWGLSDAELTTWFKEEAKVGVNDGHTFGDSGSGFVRLNFGCPHAVLREGLQRISSAVGRR